MEKPDPSRLYAVASDVVESSWNGHVAVHVGRHLLAGDGDVGGVSSPVTSDGDVAREKPTSGSATLWFVELVVGNHVVFCLCIIVLLLYIAAVVARIVLHAFWGPVCNVIIVHSFVSSGAAVDCWRSFDVPSATASAEA